MLTEVLSHRASPWRVGEKKAEREQRMRDGTPVAVKDRLPGYFPGEVIVTRRVGERTRSPTHRGRTVARPSLRDMADKDHVFTVLDLDVAGRADLESGRRKIVGGHSERVTFEDRQGALAAILRSQFSDAEEAEAKADDAFDFDGRRFVMAREIAEGFLAPTDTHTGTGLYTVKVTPTKLDRTQSGAVAGQVVTFTVGGLGVAAAYAGGYITNVTRSETRAIVSHVDDAATMEGDITAWLDTDDLDIYDAWSSGSAGLAQLETDQGTGGYTVAQELRFHEGTYNETVAASIAMLPQPEARLVMTGASGEAATIDGGAGAGLSFGNLARRYTTLKDLTINSDSLQAVVASGAGGWVVTGCNFTAPGNAGFSGNASTRFLTVMSNCTVTARYPILYAVVRADRCRLNCTGGSKIYGIRPQDRSYFEGCSFRATANTCTLIHVSAAFQLDVRNCAFEGAGFSGVYGIGTQLDAESPVVESQNNIFHDLATAYYEDTDSVLRLNSDWNIFEGNTNIFESEDGTDYATLSAWQAATIQDRTGVDSNPDANSLDDDPLMTDPANDDFSLQGGSPAIWAGRGSGVATGINDVDFDACTPDIGPWSSGAVPALADAPGITTVVASDSAVTVTLSGTAGKTYRVRLMGADGTEVDEQQRSGPGDVTLTPSDAGDHDVVAWSTGTGDERSEPSAPKRLWVPPAADANNWTEVSPPVTAWAEV